MEVWGGFFPDQIATMPVVPTGVTGDSLIVGDQTAILIRSGQPTQITRACCISPRWG